MQEQFNELVKKVNELQIQVEQLEKGIKHLEHMRELNEISTDVRFGTVDLKLMEKKNRD